MLSLDAEGGCACISRGFVRERGQGAAVRSLDAVGSAAKGRPLGATIHVQGISKTMSASSLFGDFYRYSPPHSG